MNDYCRPVRAQYSCCRSLLAISDTIKFRREIRNEMLFHFLGFRRRCEPQHQNFIRLLANMTLMMIRTREAHHPVHRRADVKWFSVAQKQIDAGTNPLVEVVRSK